MDIREINGLWCDDITFCQEKCDMRDCPRNQCNIRDHNIPHSFSVERPKDCPKGKVMPDREKVIKAYEDFVNGYECFCTSDDYEYEMHKAVLAMLKSQPQIVRCKECKYGLKCTPSPFVELIECHAISSPCYMKHTDMDWFCADGEPKGGDGE